jgi:hypothetical protein
MARALLALLAWLFTGSRTSFQGSAPAPASAPPRPCRPRAPLPRTPTTATPQRRRSASETVHRSRSRNYRSPWGAPPPRAPLPRNHAFYTRIPPVGCPRVFFVCSSFPNDSRDLTGLVYHSLLTMMATPTLVPKQIQNDPGNSQTGRTHSLHFSSFLCINPVPGRRRMHPEAPVSFGAAQSHVTTI